MKFLLLVIFSIILSSSYASDKDIYKFEWLDDDETVYVIQNKEYPTSNKFGVDFSLGSSSNSAYQSTKGITLGVSYYFNEIYSVDLMYRNYFNSNSSDLNSLLNDSGTKPLIRLVESVQMINFNWLPFYGKINTLNKIFYFYWGVGAGVGQFQTKTNYKTFLDQNLPLTYENESKLGYGVKTFVKFFMSRRWNFGIEYNLNGFSAAIKPSGETGMIWYNDLMIHVGYIF